MIRFTREHEYIRVDDNTGTVGITNYAQLQLGDAVFIDLPQKGAVLQQGCEACAIDSVKAASEIYAPVDGTVSEINDAVTANPGLINQDPQGKGWLFKMTIKGPAQLDDLMDEAAYAVYTAD